MDDPPVDETSYVLRTGAGAIERLDALARNVWPSTAPLLERAGVGPGTSCLDVGCGTGSVTMRLAELAGPEARVVGVDASEEVIAEATIRAEAAGSSATFRCCPVEDLPSDEIYDVVYARFLLSHLTDPEAALARMVAAARPGGVVVLEDVHFPGSFCSPPNEAFDRYVDLYQQAARHRGADPCLGARLPSLATEAGLVHVEANFLVPIARGADGPRFAAVTMEAIRDAVVGAGLADHDTITQLVAELEDYAARPGVVISLPRVGQIIGRRPET